MDRIVLDNRALGRFLGGSMHALACAVGPQELLLVLGLAILLFGATKIPQLGSSIGQGIRNFRRGMREVEAEEREAKKLANEKQQDDNAAFLNPTDNNSNV